MHKNTFLLLRTWRLWTFKGRALIHNVYYPTKIFITFWIFKDTNSTSHTVNSLTTAAELVISKWRPTKVKCDRGCTISALRMRSPQVSLLVTGKKVTSKAKNQLSYLAPFGPGSVASSISIAQRPLASL